MPSRSAVSVLSCLLLLSGTGCFLQKDRIRKPISEKAVQEIVPGSTTIADVDRILGSPNEIIWSNGVATPVDINRGEGIVNTFVADGKAIFVRVYHYRHTIRKRSVFTIIVFSMVSDDTKYDEVFVFFDEEGKVTHLGASLNSEDASYSPFQ